MGQLLFLRKSLRAPSCLCVFVAQITAKDIRYLKCIFHKELHRKGSGYGLALRFLFYIQFS